VAPVGTRRVAQVADPLTRDGELDGSRVVDPAPLAVAPRLVGRELRIGSSDP